MKAEIFACHYDIFSKVITVLYAENLLKIAAEKSLKRKSICHSWIPPPLCRMRFIKRFETMTFAYFLSSCSSSFIIHKLYDGGGRSDGKNFRLLSLRRWNIFVSLLSLSSVTRRRSFICSFEEAQKKLFTVAKRGFSCLLLSTVHALSGLE